MFGGLRSKDQFAHPEKGGARFSMDRVAKIVNLLWRQLFGGTRLPMSRLARTLAPPKTTKGTTTWRRLPVGDTADCQSALQVQSAFTMIEIALCLAIIGFALVAIIGVLPTGLGVQKDNREETIINQDAAVWMDAIRNGAQGYNDLTNYVTSITVYWTQYKSDGTLDKSNQDAYSLTSSTVTSVSPTPFCPLTNGARIIGLLSTPRITPFGTGGFQSNYVVAVVRSMSGSAVEKFPQDNATVLEGSFSYRLISEIVGYTVTNAAVIMNNIVPLPLDPASIDLVNTVGLTPQQIADRVKNARFASNLWGAAHDMRLTFRWPVLPNGDAGNGRQTFRVLTGGTLVATNDPVIASLNPGVIQPLYFFQPSTYVKAP